MSRWRYSIGSSMVTMWQGRVRLMWSIMVAKVVVLPEPVGPVTRTSPRCSVGQVVDDGGQPQLLGRPGLGRTRRNTMATELRW